MSRQSGATLVELVVTIVILAIALVSLTMTLSFTTSHASDSMIQVKVVELGQAYLEEILTKRFDETTPVGGAPACGISTCGTIGPDGETRDNFDDVDDYDGLDESPPRDSLNVVRGNYNGFRVQVSVAYATAAEVTSYGLTDTADLKRITATVSPPSGTPVAFSVYKGNF